MVSQTFILFSQQKNLLHCALAAAQCIVIGPVCVWGGGGGGVCVCAGEGWRSVTTITLSFLRFLYIYYQFGEINLCVKLRASILTKLGL